MSESFFFACIPRYLRVEHSFAKGIKPNTKYRIVVFKGIQKSDEMKQAIKSKIVGGKIDLESPQLFFNIPFYNPTKNIHFNLKLYEQKPNEDETQIGSYTIMSSDYIKLYKTENKAWYQVEGMLKDDLFCVFDLIVEKSKFALTDALKKYNVPVSKNNKQIADDNNSQSSRSRQAVREGQGFLSPRKKIQRKNNRTGRLRSRNSSRSDGEKSQEGSVTSSRRQFRKSPPTGRQEKFLQSPKRLSPSKNSQRPKSIPKSDISDNKIETQSQAIGSQKTYKYQPGSNIRSADKKEFVDVNIERKPERQSVVQKPQVAKSNIVSPSSQKGIQSNVSQSSVRQPVSQLNMTQPLSPRSSTQTSAVDNSVLPTSPRSVTQSVSKVTKQVTTPSVTNPKINRAQFEFKSTQKVFDIVKKKEESIIQISAQPQKVNENEDKQLNQSKVKAQVQNVQKEEQKQNQESQNKNQTSIREDKSEKTEKSIQVKEKQVKRENKSLVKSQRMAVSARLTENKQTNNPQSVEAEKLATERKKKIIYAIFLVVSAFLIYNAMMPTRRV